MARTKGAIDKRPRKRHNAKPKPPAALRTKAKPVSSESPATLPGVSPEFLQTIEAELASGNEPQAQPGGDAHTANHHEQASPPAAAPLEEPPLTKEAWQGVLRVPFRLVALLTSAPGVAAIGEKRAQDLAKPSYPIFEYYASQYLALNPENPLSLAWAATGLVLADIAADCAVAVHQARAERARALPAATPAQGAPLTQAA